LHPSRRSRIFILRPVSSRRPAEPGRSAAESNLTLESKMLILSSEFCRRSLGQLCLAAVCASAAHAQAPAVSSPGGQSTSETTTVETKVVRTGIGSGVGVEQRPALKRAQTLISAGKVDEADELLRQILSAVDRQLEKDGRTRVYVANRDELRQFAADHGGESKVVWVDWAYREALQMQAFIAAGRGDYDMALSGLAGIESLAPFDPSASIERGFVLNKLGRSPEAIECYRRAYALSQRYPSASAQAPAALRGIGFTLVELGDIKGAREAYENSLKLEPNNPTATQELEYIRSLEVQKP
jgi:tetratricopeptide (TPR) repeat protein